MQMVLSRKMGSLPVAILAVLILIAPRPRLEAQRQQGAQGWKREAAGWSNAGKTSFPFDSRDVTRGVQGLSTRMYPPSMQLRSLLCHADTVWIGTEGGLYAWSASSDSVFLVKGPPFTCVNAMAVDEEGALWVGGDEGVSVRRYGEWTHYLGEKFSFFERVRGFCRGSGRMWIATYGQGCGFMASDSLTVLTRADSLLDDRVLSVMEEDDRTVWFGTASGISRAGFSGWHSLRYGSRIPVGAVDDIILDERGNIFLAVARQGVVRYNLGRVTEYGPADGLPGIEINAFSIDSSGRVWAAGRSGVSIYDGSGWVPLLIPGIMLENYNFLSICHDVEGNTFLGTNDGKMFVISGDSFTKVELPQRFPAGTVTGIREYRGELWFISDSGIFGSGGKSRKIPSPDPWFEGALTGFALDPDGRPWVSTRFGILQFNGASWEVFDRRMGMPTEHFTWVSNGAGSDLWFGTYDSGIMRLSDTGWTRYTVENGLPPGRITGLVTDGAGTQWILSGSGRVARFDGIDWQTVDVARRDTRVRNVQAADSIQGLDPGIRFIDRAGSDDNAGDRAGLCIGTDASGNCIVCRPEAIYINSAAGWQVIELPDIGRKIEPLCVTGSRHGELWLGTAGEGIFIRRGISWKRIGACSGVSGDHVPVLFEDGTGRMWAGTLHGGVTACQWNR